MLTFKALQERSLKHYKTVHIENNREGLKDPSCVICYPSGEISEEFGKFWDWYRTKTPATTYTEYTTRIFTDLLGLDIGAKSRIRDTKLINLIGSINYLEKPELSIADIAIKIIEIFVCSKYFTLSIEQAERNLEEIQQGSPENSELEQTDTEQELFDTGIEYEIERTLEELDINTGPEDSFEKNSESKKSEETTELINTEDSELEITSERDTSKSSETESEISEYNLDLLFDLINMAGITQTQFREEMRGIFGEH